VVDVGCGWGPWLATFREHGATTLLGSTSRWSIRMRRRFDLALSLEVAEYLPQAVAPTLAFLRAHPKLARLQRETGPVPAALVHPQRYLEWVDWGLEIGRRA